MISIFVLRRSLWISLFLASICLGFYILFPLRGMTLPMVRWYESPTVVALAGEIRGGVTGLLLIRLKDGKEQFVAGSWDVMFAPSGNSFVYQTFSAGVAAPLRQTVYALEGARRISIVTMDNMKGAIVSVRENPEHTYLFIEMSDGKSSSYCIARTLSEGNPTCQEIRVQALVAEGLWNPHKERELVIRTAEGGVYAHDPWEKKPDKVDPKKEGNRHRLLEGLFARQSLPKNAIMHDGVVSRFWKFGPILLVRGASWSLYRVPTFSRLSWLVDAGHLLVKEMNELSIIDLAYGGRATLFLENGVGKKIVKVPAGD